jgi:hypothetical protein
MKISTGDSPRTHQAKSLAKLVESGTELKAAEQQIGVTLAELRKAGRMGEIAAGLLKRVEAAGLKDVERQKDVARAKLLETVLDDTDPGLAVKAAKVLLDDGRASIVIDQRNQTTNVQMTPEIIEALRSLGLPTEGSND